MVPVRFKAKIQYEPALVSVMVQYLARTDRCARFVSVGLYFDISSPRLSILDKSCPCRAQIAHVRSRARHTDTHIRTCNTHATHAHTHTNIHTHTYTCKHSPTHATYTHTHTHTHTPIHTHTHTHTHTRNTKLMRK